MEIKVGNYDVLESGSIVCMNDYPVVFTFGELSYTIIVHKDKSESEHGKNIEFMLNSKNMNLAEIHLFLKDAAALASNSPYTVGSYKGRSLSFAFYVDYFTSMTDFNMPIVLNYTWLQRDTEVTHKVTDGGVNIEEK